jgi:hypothetical protein
MAHLAMSVIFHVNVIIYQNFIYHTFIVTLLFKKELNENFQISHIISKHGSNYVKWHDSIYLQLSFKLFSEYICVFECPCTLNLFPQIYSNLPLYKMKWNIVFFNILPRLHSNIICKNIVKIFQKFEVGYT